MKTVAASARIMPVKAHILVLEARYYEDVSAALLEGALAHLGAAGATFEVMDVPGALELPGAIVMATAAERFDGFVALGCVIRGDTSHYDVVSGESARGLMDLTLEGLAIGNGILTCENHGQAMARARMGEMDKGGGAAAAALALVRLGRNLVASAEAEGAAS